jgi:hypothetical protein
MSEELNGKANSLAAIEPHRFKPGQSGNPKGRPKSAAYPQALRRMMDVVDPEDEHGRTYAEVLAETAILKAKTDIRYLSHVADRVYGKARQLVTLDTTQLQKYEQMVEGMIAETGCTREEAVKTFAHLETGIDFTPLLQDIEN